MDLGQTTNGERRLAAGYLQDRFSIQYMSRVSSVDKFTNVRSSLFHSPRPVFGLADKLKVMV